VKVLKNQFIALIFTFMTIEPESIKRLIDGFRGETIIDSWSVFWK